MRMLILALLIAATALLAACGDDDGQATDTPAPSATETVEPTASPTATPTPSPTPAPSPEPFSGSREPVERPGPDVPPAALQTAISVEAHAGFDRVTFEFSENKPGYRIEYVEPPILADGSGLPVEIEGAAFIQARFSVAQAHDDAGNSLIDDRELTPGLESVIEVEMTGDFEGYVTWAIGLPQELDFRVLDVSTPNTVSIDIAHP